MSLTSRTKDTAKKVGSVLEEVIQREGSRVFDRLIHETKKTELVPLRAFLSTKLAKTRETLVSTAISWLQTPTIRAKAQKALKGMVYSATSTTSFATGIAVPDFDVEIKRRDGVKDSISLPQAPVWVLRLFLEWLNEMLALASNHPRLSAADRKSLTEIAALGATISQSLQSGADLKATTLARFRKKMAPLELWLPTAAFETLVASLFTRAKKEEDV